MNKVILSNDLEYILRIYFCSWHSITERNKFLKINLGRFLHYFDFMFIGFNFYLASSFQLDSCFPYYFI